jgi:DNA-binding GntR family transcriptional regulator
MQQLNTHQTNGNGTSKKQFDTVPLYVQVRNTLSARIAGGEWKPEQMLPCEHTLAQAYGVSMGTIRKALDLMEREGQLTRTQGRGTFVNDKQADDDKRKRACVRKSLLLIREATNEAGITMSTRLQPVLQTYIAECLFKAGYSGDAAG